jgi:hypothetical protein
VGVVIAIHNKGYENWLFHGMVALLLWSFICIVVFAFEYRKTLKDGNAGPIALVILMTAGLLTFSGRVYGTYVRQYSPANVIIQTKGEGTNRKVISNARIIAWFSHYVAIYVSDKVIIIPAGDVERFVLR